MDCLYNNYICEQQGYCTCTNRESQTHGTLMAWGFILILCAIFIVFVAFGISAFQIINEKKIFDQNTGKQKLAGTIWLYLSPFAVGFSAFLIFVAVSLAAGGLSRNSEGAKSLLETFMVLPVGVFAVGLILTTLIYIIKNWSALLETLKLRDFSNQNRIVGLVGIVLTLIVGIVPIPILAAKIAYTKSVIAFDEYQTKKKSVEAARKNFDQYIGTYEFSTRKEEIKIVISKKSTDDALLMRLDEDSKSKTQSSENDCVLVPAPNGAVGFFDLENCIVDGKQSPVGDVKFTVNDNKTKLHFYYREGNGTILGDDLTKIK